jgi:hypothetical protein
MHRINTMKNTGKNASYYVAAIAVFTIRQHCPVRARSQAYRRIFARDKQILTLQTFGELEQAIRKLFCNC